MVAQWVDEIVRPIGTVRRVSSIGRAEGPGLVGPSGVVYMYACARCTGCSLPHGKHLRYSDTCVSDRARHVIPYDGMIVLR